MLNDNSVINIAVPEEAEIINIALAAVMTLTVLLNAVMMILTPVNMGKRGNVKAARIAMFVVNCVVVAFSVAYLTLSLVRGTAAGQTFIGDDYEFIVGGKEYYVPVISDLFSAMDHYAIYSMVGSFTMCFACAGIAVQIILWAADAKRKRHADAKNTQPDVGAAEGKENCLSQKPAQLRRVDAALIKPGNTRVLRGKTLVKSDAAGAYDRYLEERKRTSNP